MHIDPKLVFYECDQCQLEEGRLRFWCGDTPQSIGISQSECSISEIDQSEASIFKYFNWGEANAVGGWEPLSNQSLNKLPPN